MLEWFILIFVLTIFYLIMKTPKTPTEKPSPKTKTVQADVAVATETKTKKPSPSQNTPKQPQTVTPKPVSKAKTEPPVAVVVTEESPKKPSPAAKSIKKSQAVVSKPVAVKPEMTVHERVGLTAGSMWDYLAENGTTPVAKLIRELPEEEKIIQRSIGWLAQEDKITLDTDDRIEIVSLK
jgi:hypothetical protein